MATSSLGLPALNTSGLLANSSTGLNVAQLVQASMAPLEIPEQNLQNEQTQLSSQSSALGTLNSDLTAFQSALSALSSLTGGLASTAVTSSNSSVLTATSDSTASAGDHSVTVTQLATTSSYYSNELASASTTFATGSFSIQVGSGTPTNITVDSSNDTITGLAAAINAAGAGVTATVVTDKNGARLSLLSNTSGTAGQITLNTSGFTGLTFTQPAAAVDANLTVDGVPLVNGSNTVTGAIPGVTLTLTGTSSSAVSLDVTPDATQATTAINSFVSAYNQLVKDINAQYATSTSTSADGSSTTVTAGVLASDPGLMDVQEQLLSGVNYVMTGSNNGITSLSSLGITMNQDGTLTVDNSTLQNALTGNFSAVQNFFQGTSSTFGSQLTSTLSNLADPVNGPFNIELSNITTQQSDLSQQLTQMQQQLAVEQQQLLQEYSQVNSTLQTLPQMLNQINSQLGTLGGSGSTPTGG